MFFIFFKFYKWYQIAQRIPSILSQKFHHKRLIKTWIPLYKRYTNLDMKILQYICLHAKNSTMQTGEKTEIFFGWRYYGEVRSRLWSSTYKKQLGICIEYTYFSQFILWLHRGNFVNLNEQKTPSLAALQVAQYIKTVKYCA